MNQNPQTLLSDFLKVAELAGVNRDEIQINVEELPSPHRPPSKLPTGKMAVYVFSYQGNALKVGKVGPKSQARYTSQHYNPGSAPSTLAASLLKSGAEIGISNVSRENVSEWIKNNTNRFNFIIDPSCGIHVLTLLESFLQCRLQPVFEGFSSQR
jgi:hypothetical protein